MNRYYYDLHMHSCLSPCADNDNTPNNLAGMGALNGLNVMALTDHNTTKNCPAFFAAAKRQGIVPIAGTELTTAEDIHIVFLFEELEAAMEFDLFLQSRRILIKNRVDIYGEQLITDENDEVIGKDEHLLSNATTITVEECAALGKRFGAVCYPAHIDREANGIVAVLGTFPKDCGFRCTEFHSAESIEKYSKMYDLDGITKLVCSDAHYLWDVSERAGYFDIDDEPYSSVLVRKKLFEILRAQGENQ